MTRWVGATASTINRILGDAPGTQYVKRSGDTITGAVTISTGGLTLTTGNLLLSSGTITGTSNSASALAVGRQGATNPALSVDASTSSQVAGLKVTGAVSGGNVAVAVTDSAAAANLLVDALGSGTIGIGTVSTGALTLGRNTGITGTITGTSSSATALTVGANGATNPAFTVDASTASQAAGVKITGAASGGNVNISVTDSAAAANLTINALSSGTITLGNVSGGAIGLTRITNCQAGMQAFNSTAMPSAGVASIFVAKATNTTNFGIYPGAGAPSFAAAVGSIYMRSDGSSTSTRAYISINSAGATSAWTAITTAA